MIRNVILDWSGTVLDDLPAVWEASNYIRRRVGLAPLPLEAFRAEFRLPVGDYYAATLPGVALERIEAWFHEGFRAVQDQVRALPHAGEFLRWGRERGLRLFVLTTVPEAYYRAQEAAQGLSPLIEEAWTGVGDKREAIERLLSRHGLNRKETVLVGDMQHDIDAARAGGVGSCAVLTGYNGLEQLRASGPDLIVQHLGELRGLLERNGMELRRDREAGRRPVSTVGALVRNREGRWLLVQTRKWSNRWGIPGGKIEYGETAEAALRRELLEETGLAVEGVRLVLVQDCVDCPEFYRPAHFLLLNYVCAVGGSSEVRLNDEAQAYQWVTLEEALALRLNTPTRVLVEAVRREDGVAGPGV